MLKGRTVFISGATDGLGKALALRLAGQGADLILHGRDSAKGQRLLDEIKLQQPQGTHRFYLADFSDLSQIERMCHEVLTREKKIDVLINNAGIGIEKKRRSSHDGLEMTFQVNYLGTYILSRKLIPLLEAAAPSRIVNVSSVGQAAIDFSDPLLEKSWGGFQSYAQSKLAQIMCTIDMAQELLPRKITVNALHPATYMPTKIVLGLFPVQSSIEEGENAVLNLAFNPSLNGVTGQYYDQLLPSQPNAQALDARARKRLRELTSRLLEGRPF